MHTIPGVKYVSLIQRKYSRQSHTEQVPKYLIHILCCFSVHNRLFYLAYSIPGHELLGLVGDSVDGLQRVEDDDDHPDVEHGDDS